MVCDYYERAAQPARSSSSSVAAAALAASPSSCSQRLRLEPRGAAAAAASIAGAAAAAGTPARWWLISTRAVGHSYAWVVQRRDPYTTRGITSSRTFTSTAGHAALSVPKLGVTHT